MMDCIRNPNNKGRTPAKRVSSDRIVEDKSAIRKRSPQERAIRSEDQSEDSGEEDEEENEEEEERNQLLKM